MKIYGNNSHEVMLELIRKLTHTRLNHWIEHDLFSFQWWLLIAALIVPIILNDWVIQWFS